jgi:hypothetical protein
MSMMMMIIIIIIKLNCKWVLPGGSGTTIRHDTKIHMCIIVYILHSTNGGEEERL